MTNGCLSGQHQSHREAHQMQYLKGRLRLHQLNKTTSRRKIACLHSDMHRLSPHQAEAEQTLDLQLANTVTHPLSLRHTNISNNKSRQCALPNRPSNNKHLSDPNQQGSPATPSNSNSSSKCKHLWYRSINNNNKLHLHRTPRLVRHPDLDRDHDSQLPTPRLSAS